MNQNKSFEITCGEENELLPKTIDIPNSVTTTSIEPATSTDGNKNNVITDIETVEDKINPVNEIITDNNLLKFTFHSIEKIEVRPNNFIEFEVFLKSSFQSYSYLLKYNPIETVDNYVKAIQMLFENDDTMLVVQNKMEEIFSFDTQDAIVVFVSENDYSLQFVISGGSCILNDKINTSLTNDYQTTENELENMKVDCEISTEISFGNNKSLLMNGFISWHIWIKEDFNTNCDMTYNMLSNRQRKMKSDFLDKLYDD